MSGGGAEGAQASRGVGVAAGCRRRVKNAAGGWPPPLLVVVAVLALACVVW